MSSADGLKVIVSALALIWAIYQTYVNHKLSREMKHISASLDQSLVQLHRARELTSDIHIMMSAVTLDVEDAAKQYSPNRAKLFAWLAELEALALLMNDEELIILVTRQLRFTIPQLIDARLEGRPEATGEASAKLDTIVRNIYTRIYSLIKHSVESAT